MTTAEALIAFGHGFSFTRSFTHPYGLEQFGPLWVMRDGPRKKPDYRTEEWLVAGIPATEADEIVREHRRGRFAVCAFRELDQDREDSKHSYKVLGYRLGTTEKLFVHDLLEIPVFAAPCEIRRVTSQTEADELTNCAGRRQILPHHLIQEPPDLRQYVAIEAGEMVGWVRSVRAGRAAWCSNMYVQSSHRRRGIGRALMARMLKDDREAGFAHNVLLASRAGSLLYPTLGYDLIGELYVFSPGPDWGRA